MTDADERRWRQALREQLAQRGKDDAQTQRRWERYVSQQRVWRQEPAPTSQDKDHAGEKEQ